MPNIDGPSHAKQALIGSVTISKLLYTSPVWAKVAMKSAKNRAAMVRVQRTTALHTIQGYRTTSADASSVLSRMLPVDILAHKRARIHDRMTKDIRPVLNDIRKEERTISVASWQDKMEPMDSPATTQSIAVVEQFVFRTHLSLDADTDRPQVLSAISAQDESGRRQRVCTLQSPDGQRGAHHTFRYPQWDAARVRSGPSSTVGYRAPKT